MADESQNGRANKETNKELPPEFLANQWKPGQSGNPNGRPKKKWLTEVTEELLEERLSDPEFRKAYKEELWKKLMSQRVVGAMTLDKVWERTEGKVVQPVDVSGELQIRTLSERMSKAKERAK